MNILEMGVASRLWPLEGSVGGQFVGGNTVRAWQEEWAPEEEVTLVAGAWVTPGDWRLLLGMHGEGKLESHDGEVLAWVGSGAEPHTGVMALASEGSFLIKYPWDLIRVNEQVLGTIETTVGDGRAILGEGSKLLVGEGTRILPGVYVEGTVVIGKDCKIGPNCYLRGSTAIGDGCHIGQAVEVKNSVIGSKTNVGHLSYVGDSVLGSGVNFGAGTMTSNLRHDGRNHRSMVEENLIDTGRRKFGTVVGNGVHTGIQTAIYPGRKLGPGTHTLPGEVVNQDKRQNPALPGAG